MDQIRIRSAHETDPAHFMGFLWPIEGIVFPADWLTDVHKADFLEARQIVVERKEDGMWMPMSVKEEGAGPPPASPPRPTSEALLGAKARGIECEPFFWKQPDTPKTIPDFVMPEEKPNPPQPVVKTPPDGYCTDCGKLMSGAARAEGHKAHSEYGKRCPGRRRKNGVVDQDGLTSPNG